MRRIVTELIEDGRVVDLGPAGVRLRGGPASQQIAEVVEGMAEELVRLNARLSGLK